MAGERLPRPVLCPQCGMPDVREVVRRELGESGQWIDRVDLRCTDCAWSRRDEGGES
jgi:hypothetical protein